MKRIGICNNKGGVGKTTICFCLGGALAEMGKKILLVDMDQQGSLSSSFLPNIHDLPCVITDALLNDKKSIKEAVIKTEFENIDIANNYKGSPRFLFPLYLNNGTGDSKCDANKTSNSLA